MSKNAVELSQAFGYLYLGEVALLKELAKSMPEGFVFVNIGAGAGTSSLSIVEDRLDVRAFTVDISPGGPLGGMENEFNAFSDAGLVDFLPTQLLGDSPEVGSDWNLGPIDMVFIDGDHSAEGLSKDIISWLPHVRSGGVMAFHDYESTHWPAVVTVVDQMMSDYEVIGKSDTVIAFKVKDLS